MEFSVVRASDWESKEERVVINTIEELQELAKRYGNNGIIVYFDCKRIWIYDDYME